MSPSKASRAASRRQAKAELANRRPMRSEVTLPPELEALRATPAGRRWLARSEPAYFQTYYLMRRYYAHQREWLRRLREVPRGGRTLLLAPRSHGKTDTVTSHVLQAIAENRNIRILIVSQTLDVAKKRLARVKAHLEGNTRLIEDYGRFKPEKIPRQLVGLTVPDETTGKPAQIGYWTQKYVYVVRSSDAVDPTVEAVGAGGAITGGRFDLILADDPIDDKATGETERKKIREWWYGTITELLETGGRIIVVGTRKHHDDLYATLIKDPKYRVIHDRGILQWPDGYEGVYERDEHGREILVDVHIKGECKVLCPEMWSARQLLEKLLSAQATVGSRIFLREIQNEVTDDATSQFPLVFFRGGPYQATPTMPARQLRGCLDPHRRWLQRRSESEWDPERGWSQVPPYQDGVLAREHLGLEHADIEVYQMWDLALVADKERAETNDTDYTVGLTVALDKLTWTRYLVGIFRDRGLHPNAVMRAICEEYWRFGGRQGHVNRVIVESVLFQRVYELMLQDQTDLPILGHSTGREKADPYRGIPALSALHENGKVRYPYATPADRMLTDVIVAELNAWPAGDHDDILLSMFVGEQRILVSQAVTNASQKSTGRPRVERPSLRRSS